MKRNNKGFTLVEVVLAIVIAVLVSVAAASVILATRSGIKEAVRKNNAVAQANAVVECFKASKNLEEFESGLEFTYLKEGDTLTMSMAENNVYFLYFKNEGKLSSRKTAYDSNEMKKCDYFACVQVKDCSEQGGKFVFAAKTSLDVLLYEKGNMPGSFDPFDRNGEDYKKYETQLIYSLERSCRKGSV